jgi:predicted Zn-dependent protease
MQVASVDKPGDLFELISWMNEHDLSLAVTEWADHLPADVASRYPVCVCLADAYARASAWATLRAKVEKAKWQQDDALRLAYLSRALERLNDVAGAQKAWSDAVTTAQASTTTLETLAKDVEIWGWDEHDEEMLAKLADRPDCPRWALEKLWTLGLSKGETGLLVKVAKLKLQADPKNVTARARFVSLSLLTGQETKTTPAMAEALAKENPTDPSVVSLQALSLYQQGHAEQAVALMDAFPAEKRREPRIALYYGTFMAALGKSEEAEEYLALGASAPQLPEEKALWEYLRSACQARNLDRKGDQKGAEDAWNAALAATRLHLGDLETLARLAHGWEWKARRDQALLALAAKGDCPAWAADLLWPAALASGDSNQIYNAAHLLHQQDARNAGASVNFVFTSLLTRREAGDPRRLVESLHQQTPDDPAAASALGLALLQEGKAEDAVALMKTLSPAQLGTAPAPLYYGIFLAAAGQGDKVPAIWPGEASALRFPEEKAMVEFLQPALRARAVQQSGDTAAADAAWSDAFAHAKKRPDWLEILGRMALNWGWDERTEQTLWPLATSDKCPRWVIETLSGAAEKKGDSGKLYQVSKLQATADPKNLQARTRFIYLSLLTGHDTDFPDRLAQAIHSEYPADPDATTSYAFSLYRHGKVQDALNAMARLKPDQLKQPRTALYYGIFLTAAGQDAKATDYLQAGAEAVRLPEEKTLLAAAKSGPRLGASR